MKIIVTLPKNEYISVLREGLRVKGIEMGEITLVEDNHDDATPADKWYITLETPERDEDGHQVFGQHARRPDRA